MTAKEYLQQAQKLDRRIQLNIEKLAAMRSSLYNRALYFGSDGAQHKPDGNSMERAVFRVMEYEERIDAEIDELTAKKLEIEKAIAAVPDEVQREILTRRYLLYQKWENIADELHYSYRRVTQLHGVALKYISLNFPLDM